MKYDYSSLTPDLWRDIAGFLLQNITNENPFNLYRMDSAYQKLAPVMGMSAEDIQDNVMKYRATGPIWGDRFEGDDNARESYLRDRAVWMTELSDALGVQNPLKESGDIFYKEMMGDPKTSTPRNPREGRTQGGSQTPSSTPNPNREEAIRELLSPILQPRTVSDVFRGGRTLDSSGFLQRKPRNWLRGR